MESGAAPSVTIAGVNYAQVRKQLSKNFVKNTLTNKLPITKKSNNENPITDNPLAFEN